MDTYLKNSKLNHKDFKLERLITFRHELHQYPELSFQENETKQRLISYLNNLPNFTKYSKITETETAGFWIDMSGTNERLLDSPLIIGLRADMDALPIEEKTGKPYTSKNQGIAHVCGHDGHMAILIGTIEYFLLNLDKLPKNFGARFVFQPAEEIGAGAIKLVNAGCLKDVSEMYGLHNIAKTFKSGEIACCHKTVFAGCDVFNIIINGKGGHGSTPHLCNNPIIPAASIILAINQIPAQEVNAKDTCVLSVGKVISGTKENIIPDTAQIKGTVRTLTKETSSFIFRRITEISQGISKLYNCECIVEKQYEITPTVNSKNPTDLLFNISKKYFSFTLDNLPVMFSEDFGVYAEYIPSCFFLLGGEDEECNYSPHSPNYNFNDKTLGLGIEVFLRIIEAKSQSSILSH